MRNGRGMVGHVQHLAYFFAADRLVGERRVLHANALNQAARDPPLVAHIQQLVLKGRTAAIQYKNEHDVYPAFPYLCAFF